MNVKKGIKSIIWILFGLPFWIVFTIVYCIFVADDYKKYIIEEDKS